MEILTQKFKRDGNAKVYSLYYGVGSGGRVVTKLVMPSADRNHMEATRTYEPGMPRGQGGQAAVIILGGMETTLDEMQYILETRKQKKFVPRRSGGEIAGMCQLLRERRNNLIRHYRKNPSEAPKPKRTARIYLPAGFRYVETSEPGLKVLARV